MPHGIITPEFMGNRWKSAERPPFKGKLISPDGCCCAQGDVLRCSGWTDEMLRETTQSNADREVAKILGISLAHVILLRNVNDKQDGCPQDVLLAPENVLGVEAQKVLAFWRHFDAMTMEQWNTVVAAITAASYAARVAAGYAARVAAITAAGYAARVAAGYAARVAARVAARDAAGYAAGYATNEIQGHSLLGSPFFFLPMFGFSRIEDLNQMVSTG